MSALKRPAVAFPPPLVPLLGIILGAFLDRVLPWQLPALPRQGAALAMIAALVALWAVLTLRHHRTTVLPQRAATTLVMAGPFRFSRNPIYLAFLLVQLGAAAAWGSVGMLLTLPIGMLILQRWVIAPEEQFHAQQFGDAWHSYRQRVRRWL
ncbi:isoprenylcysteine carboxylmethyltransferase family protein [Alcanivorax sp. REN37]|uniref:Isoprenylcysteine carboxylmethyltransferase family protein n=1 Tax=Isoalcanivorax beigongshangi TaxID=3238810 RepID=A0ABV4AER1_9GAMM